MRDVMTEGTEIFQQYADHLAKKAASVVVSLAVVGTVGGAFWEPYHSSSATASSHPAPTTS